MAFLIFNKISYSTFDMNALFYALIMLYYSLSNFEITHSNCISYTIYMNLYNFSMFWKFFHEANEHEISKDSYH